MEDKYTMTDSDLELTVKNLRKSNEFLTRAINFLSNPASLINNDKLTLFYTGIPSYKMFDSLVKLILPHTKVFICSSPETEIGSHISRFSPTLPDKFIFLFLVYFTSG